MANRFARFVETAQPAPAANRFARFAQDAAQEPATLRANASGSAGAVNKKAEAIWGGSFDDWKKRKEADDAERARMVAESEAGNVGSRRAQEFQRETAILAETDALRNKPGEFNFGATGQMMRAGAERAIGGALRFAGESAAPVVGLMDAARNPEAFVRGTTDRGEIPSNAVLAAGQDNALANVGSELAATGATRARRAQPLLIDRPDDALSVDGLKYYAQQGAISAPQLATTVAAGYLGGPAAALLAAGGTAFGTKFADARDENQDFSQAARGALVTAANEAIPEMLPAAAALGKLSRFMPDWMADGIVSRLIATGAAEGSTEGITEAANIAYETFGENKPMDRTTFVNRVKDAVITGGLAGSMVGAVTGTAEYGQARDEVRDDAMIRSLRAAIKPRATTARILGPTATPDAAAGAQIADDAFRAAGVGTVAAADIAEQDALARDLDAAQRDQLGSEAEIDRLLTGNAPRERTDLYRASIPGAIPQGVHVSTNQDAFAAPGTIGGRDAPAPIQVTTLPDRSVFVPGDPVAIRQKLADAGSQWQGMAQERDGVPGVRFGRNAWQEVQGVVGGNNVTQSVAGNVPSVTTAGSAALRSPAVFQATGTAGAVAESNTPGGDQQRTQPTQAAVAVDGRNLAGNEQRSIGGSIAPTANVAPEVAEAPAAAPPLDLTARRTNSDTKFDERVHDLTDFIALNGGLDRSALESEGIDPANWNSRKAKGQNDKFFGKPLFRKTGGMTLETLREKARDAGFRTDKDVLDLISESLGGRKTFTPAGSEYQMALADVARQEADAQARQQRVNALPLSVPETDADAYIASRETEFDAPADRDGADLADIESTLASVADTSPQQRASVVSLGHDYTAKLIELKRARAAGALNPDQQEAYIDLLEQDRETGKVAGRPMIGIGNKTAYVDAQMQGKLMPVQVFLDADNFKALNDKFGHDVGDDAIRLIADVVRAEFGEGNVFHRGGDEFLTQGMTREEVDAKMARVQSVLANYVVDLPLSDGRTATLEGIGVSYGTGANEKAADESLKQDKQRRKEAGLRFDRREGDGVGRVGSGPTGARTDASRTDANPQDRTDAAAEGVGDVQPDTRTQGAVRAADSVGQGGSESVRVRDNRRGGSEGSARDGLSIQSARTAISQSLGAKFLRRLESQPWFHLVGTLADLPANIRKSITDGGNVAGFVLGNDVYIIADQASDPVGVTLHEVGVHFGMSGILGADFPAVLRNFKRQRAKDAAVGRAYERATEAAERGEDGELTADALATLDEEALAYYVEANWNAKDTRGIVAKVIDAIKSMLNRLGIPLSTLNASPELLRKVAIGAARKAADGRVSVGKDGGLRYHKAWHGSPHDFDKFRYDDTTSHTGEGAQAYGAGLYFAGNQEVAEHYRKPGPWSHRSDIMIDGVSVKRKAADSEAEKVALNALARTVTKADAIDYLQQDSGTEDAVDWIVANSARITDTAGRLYEVELAPDESDYLDWDAPLSEQSSKVQQSVYNLLTDLGVSSTVANYYASSKSGADVYREISRLAGGDKAASTKLRSERVPGIRYLDGSSRGNGEGSRNYVIFDDSQVEVKAKYSRRVQDGRIRKTVAELTNAADSMKSWRDWYDRHDQTLRDVFGDDAELFQKLLSATSQAASVPANIGLALKAYRQLFSGEPFTGYLPAVIKNLDRVAENVALRGQKISEYGSANEGNADAIAVDRHIAMLFFGTKSPNAKQVASAKQRIRTIAERLGWQPREIQAALWAYNQTLLGTRPEDVKSYDTIIEKNRGRIDELRASIGRGEDRGAREVGGTAGRDGSAERDSAASREQARAEVGPKYSRRADGGPESLRVVTAGDVVDGRTVREGVPNQSSIASSLDDYTIIKGIREVPMDAFDKEYVEGIAEGRIDKRTQDLADAISASKEITPLIVAYDADGAYIIEGGHRLDALIKIGAKSLPAMVVIDEANPPKLASEGLGASGDTDARIAYSRRTAEPEGLPPPVAIESHLSNMLKLRAFWDSAVDVMARQPGLKPLADAVRSYFDNVRRRQGLVNEVLRAPVKAASKADLDAFERYQYALQNNLRADVSEELAGMTDKGRALVSAWEKVAKLTNDENQKVGVQVFDPKIGGWRKIGTARNFFPRVLKPMFQEAMRQPHKYPTEWNRLVRILLDAGRIQSAEDAQEFLNTAFSNESAFEYFAGIEKARMEPLPRDLYDYSMDAAIGYKDAWADRLSQIEAFGQKIGQGDQAKDKFDEVLMTVTDDNTRNYVTRVRERITNTNSKSPFYKFMANMNTLVTGLMLGNPATAALNIVGGLSNNAMVFPIGPNLKALKELRKLGDGIRDAVAKGVLIDDYMGVSADAAAQGVSERLSNLTQGLLNWGGYNGTEYINRVHSMLVGKHFLSDSLAAINKNPRSRKSLLATAFLQRNGFDIDTLAAESTKPADERPETNKFLRFASNLTQGSYKIDQTPIFVDEPIGKFLFKYQKFGTQINRVFYQQVLKPFAQSVFRGGEPVTLKNADGTEAQERVRNFVPLLRFIAAAIPGGMLVQFIREALFGYGEDGPDEDEIRRKLADGETAAAAAMLAERAFIAITALGAGGFLGNYMQTAKDFQERQRFKNPLDPPGLAPVKSFANFVMKLNDQGKITLDDIEQEIQNNVSLYRTGKRLLSSGINMVNDESVTFAAREAARREHNHVRYMARRYAGSVGIEAKRRAPSEIAATANTPTNRAIKDALLLGDGETARALAAEYVASFDNAYDAANALASIRNSIRLGQPALVQLAPSETERRRFMRWAFSNLTPEGYARIKDTDEKYRKAAASSGLWKPESDAAAMKRDRKADESKAQWSDSQRNSFLRSKGLKR